MSLKILAAAVLAGVVIPAGAAAAPTAGANVLVDQDHGLKFPQNKQNENSITRDPFSGVLIAGANDESGLNLCRGATAPLTSPCPFTPGVSLSGYYRSTDGGASWSGGLLPTGSGYVPGGDPSLDYGPRRCADGTFRWACGVVVYFASLGDPYPEFAGEQLLIHRSYDDGATWSPPSVATSTDNKSNFDDHEWIAVDRSSAHFGRLYLFWAVYCNTCSGNGNVKLYVAHSDNEGRTFTAALKVGGTAFNLVQGMSARVDCYPHPASDPSSARVYVVWCDFAGGHGVVKAAVSSNGVDWTNLGTIADVRGRNAFFGAVAVAPNGTVAVTFDALTAPPADDPWSTGVQVYDNYYVESRDGGASFTAPLRVSSASSNPDASSYNNLMEQFIGDYIGIVAGPTQAYLVWTDARDASRCQAVDAYRDAVYAGSKTAVAPNPDVDCATSFGNT